jgi:predicted CopG family antitoxin
MTNITLSIDDEVYNKMKSFSEVKWSEFVRKCIQQRVNELNKLKSYADETLLSENWLSKEDNSAWKSL